VLLGLDVGAQRGVDDDQLQRHAACLIEEGSPLLGVEVAVEVAGEHSIEVFVVERERERVAADEAGAGRLPSRLLEHALALVEADDLAPEVLRQEPCAAGDVEGARRLERRDRGAEGSDLLLPPQAVALGEETVAPPPVVVLRCAPVVVGLHAS
jgi:hypothetical protein